MVRLQITAKLIIIQLSDSLLCKIFISTDFDTIIVPDITSKLYTGVIFLTVVIWSWGGEREGKMCICLLFIPI
jgi:hypothetical protein